MTHCVKCGDDLHESRNVLCEDCYTRALTQADPPAITHVVYAIVAIVAVGLVISAMVHDACR